MGRYDTKRHKRKVERAIELVRTGMSYRNAARTVGLDKRTVSKYCKRVGVISQHTLWKTAKIPEASLKEKVFMTIALIILLIIMAIILFC